MTTRFGMPELELIAQHITAAPALAHHSSPHARCAPPSSSGSLGWKNSIPFLPVGARLIELVDGVRVLLGIADLVVAVFAGVVGLHKHMGFGGGGSLFQRIILVVCSVARRAALVPIIDNRHAVQQ